MSEIEEKLNQLKEANRPDRFGAYATNYSLEDSWKNLKQNPVFNRTMIPRGIRGLYRNPVVRAILLSGVALLIYEQLGAFFPSFGLIIISAAIFWTLIYSIQHFFTWGELTSLSVSGNLNHYISSGLTKADIAMGVIYPARISETISVSLFLTWFLISLPPSMPGGKILFAVLIFLVIFNLFKAPSLFLPDVENYLRKRNPVSLYFISLSNFVPMVIWFTVYFLCILGILYLNSMITSLNFSADLVFISAFILAWLLNRFPARYFQVWRLKRFYSRYDSFDDLFDRYITQQEYEEK